MLFLIHPQEKITKIFSKKHRPSWLVSNSRPGSEYLVAHRAVWTRRCLASPLPPLAILRFTHSLCQHQARPLLKARKPRFLGSSSLPLDSSMHSRVRQLDFIGLMCPNHWSFPLLALVSRGSNSPIRFSNINL